MNNVTDININKAVVDTRDIRTLSPEEIQMRAANSIAALKVAMTANDVAGALAALRGYSEQIDIESYFGSFSFVMLGPLITCG